MASTINASTSAGLVSTADTSGVLQLQTAGTTAITVDASQNMGLGVTPSAWNTAGGAALQVKNVSLISYANVDLELSHNSFYDGTNYKYIANGFATQYTQYVGTHYWSTAASGTAGTAISFTQAMTLNASGNLMVNTTSTLDAVVSVVGRVGANAAPFALRVGTSGDYGFTFRNDAGTFVGAIGVNASTTSYVTSSDYRLKENIAPMAGALTTVAQLKPCTYTWKVDGSDGQGFIAHELAEVFPDAVTGAKDAVDEDGNIKSQGIDTSFLVATLTAAIQEQQAIIESLKSRLDAANL